MSGAARGLFVDCFSGVSGDMFLGALLHLGAARDFIDQQLSALGVEGWHLTAEPGVVQGISGIRARVRAPGPHGALAEGIPLPGGARLVEGASPGAPFSAHKRPGRSPAGATHVHRPWSEIDALLARAPLHPQVREDARAVFHRLAVAEGAIHGVPPGQVEFHEVGSVDALIDVVGVCAGLEALGRPRISCAPLPMGSGMVDCAHGRFPLPAPAVLELVRGVPVRPDPREGEWVTPTGAALVTALAERFGPLPPMTVERTGYGLGSRDGQGIPNVLRLILGRPEVPLSERTTSPTEVLEISTNLDDMSPQLFAPLLAALFSAGALDAWLTPVQMKKDRPGVMVSALAEPDREREVIEVLLRDSTSLGVRLKRCERVVTPRRFETLNTPYGAVVVKIGEGAAGFPNVMPEYESCRVAAERHQVPVKLVQQEAIAAAAVAGLLKRA